MVGDRRAPNSGCPLLSAMVPSETINRTWCGMKEKRHRTEALCTGTSEKARACHSTARSTSTPSNVHSAPRGCTSLCTVGPLFNQIDVFNRAGRQGSKWGKCPKILGRARLSGPETQKMNWTAPGLDTARRQKERCAPGKALGQRCVRKFENGLADLQMMTAKKLS